MQFHHILIRGRPNSVDWQQSNREFHWLLHCCEITTWGHKNTSSMKNLQCRWNRKPGRAYQALHPSLHQTWKPIETSKILCHKSWQRTNNPWISMVGRIQPGDQLERWKTLRIACPTKNPSCSCKRATEQSHLTDEGWRNTKNHSCTANGREIPWWTK